jgi:hypothetical protein
VVYKNKNYTKNSKYTRKKLFVLFVSILAILVILFVLEKSEVINLYNDQKQPSTTTEQDEINLNPPTEEELQAVEDNKNKLSEEIDKSNNAVPPPQKEDGKIDVKPVIGYIEIRDEQIRANGFISTMIEEGGTCTLTLSRGEQKVQTTTTSLADAQSTICGLMLVNKNDVSNGSWTATLSYSSDKYEGVSDEQIITIQ